jgi:hypothetical protein
MAEAELPSDTSSARNVLDGQNSSNISIVSWIEVMEITCHMTLNILLISYNL